MIKDKKFTLFLKDYYTDFKGWDFSYIESTRRMQEFPLDWSYRSIVLNYLYNSKNLLDMGTGGGEFLSNLNPLPKNTFATESFKPNIELARKNLQPLGISIIETDNSGKLPLNDNSFDLVINRHEYYDQSEVYRILKKDGYFITQQVGEQNARELNDWFESKKINSTRWNLDKASKDLVKLGFTITENKENITKTRFYDIGAVLYFLKAIPWQIKDFTIEKYYPKIEELHKKIEFDGFFDVSCHRFIIISKK